MNSNNSYGTISIQRQLKEDWDNREFIQLISDNVKNIAEFLNHLGNMRNTLNCKIFLELSCKSRLAALNDSLFSLERKVEFLEAKVL